MTKHIILIAALIAAPFTATLHAEHEKVLVAISKATWDDASPTKRDKIKIFFRRFVTEGHGVSPQATYIHTATSNEVLVACYDSGKLHDHNTEDITELKMEELRVSLDDKDIKVKITTDPHAQLAAWGLEAPVSDEL
jgi:hypothetical protein